MMNPNQNPYRRGFSRNGAPQGYGQQRGASPFLDQPQDGERERDPSVPPHMASEPGAPAAPAPPWQQALERPSGVRQLHRGPNVSGTYGEARTAATGQAPQDYYRDTAAQAPPQRGYGSPESGYGAGGVNSPAYGGQGAPQGAQGAGDDQAWRMSLRQRALSEGGPGRSSGWNTGDYGGDQVAATSMKNTFHAIAQRYPSTPSGLRQMVQDEDFKRAFPSARLVEHPTGDKIDFGGQLSDFSKGTPVGIVDVGRAFNGESDTGEGWDWMDENDAPAQGGPQGAPPPGGSPVGGGPQEGGMAAKLLAALQAQQGGSIDTNVSIEQLLANLGLI